MISCETCLLKRPCSSTHHHSTAVLLPLHLETPHLHPFAEGSPLLPPPRARAPSRRHRLLVLVGKGHSLVDAALQLPLHGLQARLLGRRQPCQLVGQNGLHAIAAQLHARRKEGQLG